MSVHDDLLNLDFNSLRTLQQVHRLGSFSKAADAIDVKQSTVSYTIDRLRKALNDPLFVRQGGHNIPTTRCRDLIPIVESILANAERMNHPGEFDPSRAKAEISIICSTYGMLVILPAVFRRLRNEAPGISLNLMQRFQSVAGHLIEGKADLALVLYKIEENGLFSLEPLISDYAVCITDPANPLVGKTLTRSQLAAANHIRGQLWANWKQPYVAAAEKLGIKIQAHLTVADQVHLPTFIRGTDLIGGMPSRLARSFGDQLGIAQFPFRASVDINMYWSAASNNSPLNAWLRQIIIEEVDKIEKPIGD